MNHCVRTVKRSSPNNCTPPTPAPWANTSPYRWFPSESQKWEEKIIFAGNYNLLFHFNNYSTRQLDPMSISSVTTGRTSVTATKCNRVPSNTFRWTRSKINTLANHWPLSTSTAWWSCRTISPTHCIRARNARPKYSWRTGTTSSSVPTPPRAANCCRNSASSPTRWIRNWHLCRPSHSNKWASVYRAGNLKWFKTPLFIPYSNSITKPKSWHWPISVELCASNFRRPFPLSAPWCQTVPQTCMPPAHYWSSVPLCWHHYFSRFFFLRKKN